jgi:hypothetical protein
VRLGPATRLLLTRSSGFDDVKIAKAPRRRGLVTGPASARDDGTMREKKVVWKSWVDGDVATEAAESVRAAKEELMN